LEDSPQETSSCVWSTNSPHLIKPDSSLQLSQDHANGPCPEPVQSSPHPYTLFNVFFNIILPHFCDFQVLSSIQYIQLKYGTNFPSTHAFELKNVSVLNSHAQWKLNVARYTEAGEHQFDICRALDFEGLTVHDSFEVNNKWYSVYFKQFQY
jgi:hypothetical protein